jgi:hypoxanthine phosphoribosyltransferase
VPWDYEPRSFPIGWDRNGQPSQFFTPDFYLPDDDLFIEITTMSQKLVTKKNGKVRRLRELYPDVTCKILYQRDYLHLVVKYGLETPEHIGDVAPTRIPGPPQVTRLADRGAGLPLESK